MNLTFPDELKTQRLVLRRWRAGEAPELKAAIDANLAHLQAWMPWAMSEPSPIEAVEERVARFEDEFTTGVEWLYAIRARGDGAVIGGCGLHPRIGSDGLEIGYWLAAAATGQGFATESAGALTRAAFKHTSIVRMQIRCDPRNGASSAVAERLGYRHIETLIGETSTPTGAPRDTMVWELTRKQFAQRPNDTDD